MRGLKKCSVKTFSCCSLLRNAYLKAVRARRAAEKHEGISVKHRHHPVQWGAAEAVFPAQLPQAGGPDIRARSAIDDRVQPSSSAGAGGAGTTPQKEKTSGRPREERSGNSSGVTAHTSGNKASDGDRARCSAGLLTCDKGTEEDENHGSESVEKGGSERTVHEGQDGANRPDALLTTHDVSVRLTPLERVARATDLDFEELTERVARAARTQDGAKSFFSEEHPGHVDEMNAAKQGKSAEKKSDTAAQVVSENLELAMVRETADVILSDLYR